MLIYYLLLVVLGFNPILFIGLYLGSPPCGSFVHYVGVFNVFYCRFESEGGHSFFLTLLFSTETPFIL